MLMSFYRFLEFFWIETLYALLKSVGQLIPSAFPSRIIALLFWIRGHFWAIWYVYAVRMNWLLLIIRMLLST